MKFFVNSIISEGYICGPIYKPEANKNINLTLSVDEEIKKLDDAITLSVSELDKLNANKNLKDYVLIQKMMVTDPLLYKNTINYIKKKMSAYDAICEAMDELSINLKKSNSLYLQSRSNDLEDVLKRITRNLNKNIVSKLNKKYILVTDHLYPSMLMEDSSQILGIIAKEGGYLSHSAIIARSLDIPYVIVKEEINGENAIIDTRKNMVIINPKREEINSFLDEYKNRNTYLKKAIPHDGYLFYANVQSNEDIKKAVEYGFDGIGLYRTEMIFMNLDRPYTFDEQFRIYKEALNLASGRPITFRTFDVGDDKKIAYLNTNKKSIDNYLNNKDIFETQVKAILSASQYGNARIMFPMIENNDEFNILREWVIKIANSINVKVIPIGMMLECENALKNIDSFTNVDFISVGTNDLSMSIYHIKRDEINTIDFKDDLINRLIPAVNYAKNKNITISVCGEMAAIKDDAINFYKIGINALSVNPRAIRMLNAAYEDYIKDK